MHTLKKIGVALIVCIMMLCTAVGYTKAATLKEGSKSSAVKSVQRQLIKLGYLDKQTKVTGYYGKMTMIAVMHFQLRNGLPPTGTLDDLQQKALFQSESASLAPMASNTFLPEAAAPVSAATALAPTTAPIAPMTASQPMISPESIQKIEYMIAYGMQYLGTSYKRGGHDPSTGFDCSGFVRYVLQSVDIKAPSSAQTQGDNEDWPKINNPGELRRGDLVFFHTSGRSVEIGHSGIYLGNNEFLHSEPTGGGVIISTVFGTESDGRPSYYNKNYLFARRIFK